MHERTVEERLRSTLRSEADSMPTTVTVDELERRLALRGRDRANRRLGLVAAAIGAVAVGTAFAFALGPFRGPQVAATPEPTLGPTTAPTALPTIGPSTGPIALPELEPTAGAVDHHAATQAGDPTSTDDAMQRTAVESVGIDAREAGIKFVCAGTDYIDLHWGTPDSPTAIASEFVPCNAKVATFRYDLSGRQPLIDDSIYVEAGPRPSWRILVETFGSMTDPRPTALPAIDYPAGTGLLQALSDPSVDLTRPVGSVPPRGYYRVAMVCLGTGTATWTIGKRNDASFVDGGQVACDGGPVGFPSGAGLASGDRAVYVSTDPGNAWHLAISDPYGAIDFVPPDVEMYAGADFEGRPASAPAQCVNVDGNGDSCGLDLDPRDGARRIGVPHGGDVSFIVADGWTITQASVHIADRDDVRKNGAAAHQREYAVGDDGSGRLTRAGDRMTLSLAAVAEGDWLLVVTISAERGSSTFGAAYQLPVRISR